jgi:hypothetical protein
MYYIRMRRSTHKKMVENSEHYLSRKQWENVCGKIKHIEVEKKQFYYSTLSLYTLEWSDMRFLRNSKILWSSKLHIFITTNFCSATFKIFESFHSHIGLED